MIKIETISKIQFIYQTNYVPIRIGVEFRYETGIIIQINTVRVYTEYRTIFGTIV